MSKRPKLSGFKREWLLRRFIDGQRLQAPADSTDDKMLQRIEETGAITQYDAMFGNNYYALTKAGRAVLTRPMRDQEGKS